MPRSELRPACLVPSGSDSTSCPVGSAGDGASLEGDLDPSTMVAGIEARFAWLEKHPDDYFGARAAQLRTIAPHLDDDDDDEDDDDDDDDDDDEDEDDDDDEEDDDDDDMTTRPARKEDSMPFKNCNCETSKTDTIDDDHWDDNLVGRLRMRADAQALLESAPRHGPVDSTAAAHEDTDDTSEEAAKAALRAHTIAASRTSGS